MNRHVAIIHFNTPELTEAAIMSIRKHGGMAYKVTVFDNSNLRPFTKQMYGVEVIDNTKGQIIDFDKELAKYPDKCPEIGVAKNCNYGSVKHMMTVQKLWELIPEGFVLMESDILLKQGIDDFFRPEYSIVGYVQRHQPYNKFGIGRVMPMLCWMNVPMLTKEGAMYFDPQRSYGLQPGGKNNRNNWYDTGAALLEDILQKRPRLKGLHVDIRMTVEHFGSGSWKKNSTLEHQVWLNYHRKLWEIKPAKVAVCAIGRKENLYAKEWVEHYRKLGIDKIIIYDNNRKGEERFEDVLEDYKDFVQIIPWDGVQKHAYENCYNRFSNGYDWMGFLDFDEFVQTDGASIPELLAATDADVMVLNWRTMTDNGQLHYEDRPVVERFTEGTDESFSINRHTKCFVRRGIKDISFNDPHCPNAPVLKVVNVLGERVNQTPLQPKVIHSIARVDHYNTKSAEEWRDIKCKRGTCCGDAYTERWMKTNVEYFFGINERTPEKEAILSGKSKPKNVKRRKRKEE